MSRLTTHKNVVLVFAFLILSWWGALDSLATVVNAESISEAAIIYGLARSINGVISLLQSGEIGAFVGSVHPGELLDPINDLIERFSSVMAWSLSSLVLQKLLLAIFGSYSFKVIFTIFCILTLLADRIFSSEIYLKRIWLGFLAIASLRFSIAIVCGLTAIIDYGFIQKIEETSLKTVKAFNSDISAGINENVIVEEEVVERLEALRTDREHILSQLNEKKSEIDKQIEKLNTLDKPSILSRIFGEEKSSEVLDTEKKISDLEDELDLFQENLTTVDDLISCAELRKAGQSCEGNWSKLKSMFSPEKITNISRKIDETIHDLITILVTLVLTTMVLPMIFLYTTYRLFKFSIFALVTFDARLERKHSIISDSKSN